MHVCGCTFVHALLHNLVRSCLHYCAIAYPCAVMHLCPCACTIAHNYAVMRLYIRALVHALLHNLVRSCSCACIIAHTCAVVRLCLHYCAIAYPCAVMPLCLHNCTQLCNYAFVHSCACAVRAAGKAEQRSPANPANMLVMPSRTLPTCFPCRTC